MKMDLCIAFIAPILLMAPLKNINTSYLLLCFFFSSKFTIPLLLKINIDSIIYNINKLNYAVIIVLEFQFFMSFEICKRATDLRKNKNQPSY